MATRISERVGLFNRLMQSSLFSTIFIFNSNIRGIRAFFERSVQAILFPIAVIPDIITSLLALFNFTQAKNRNLGKTFDLIYNPLKTALVVTAVFAGLSLIAIHSLFLTVVGSSLVYHTGVCLYNAYLWLKAPKSSLADDVSRKNTYKKNVIQHGIAAFSTSLAIAGILLTMVFAPYLGASILAIGGITIAVLTMSITLYTLYKHFRGSARPVQLPHAQVVAEEEASLDPSQEHVISQAQASNGYYYQAFRSQKLTGQEEDDRKFLHEEIQNKVQQLNSQIEQSEARIEASKAHRLLSYFFSEKEKREIKKQYLGNLLDFMEKLDRNEENIPFIPHPPRGTFQSFWRATSDVQDIYEAAEHLLDRHSFKRENKLIESPLPDRQRPTH